MFPWLGVGVLAPKNKAGTIVLSIWLLLATVLVNAYTGTLLSILVIPERSLPVNSLEDLSTSQLGVLLQRGTIWENLMKVLCFCFFGNQIKVNLSNIILPCFNSNVSNLAPIT